MGGNSGRALRLRTTPNINFPVSQFRDRLDQHLRVRPGHAERRERRNAIGDGHRSGNRPERDAIAAVQAVKGQFQALRILRRQNQLGKILRRNVQQLAILQREGAFAIEHRQHPAGAAPHAVKLDIDRGQPCGNGPSVILLEMLENIDGNVHLPVIFRPSLAWREAISTTISSPSSVLAEAMNSRHIRRGRNADLRIADGKAGINLKRLWPHPHHAGQAEWQGLGESFFQRLGAAIPRQEDRRHGVHQRNVAHIEITRELRLVFQRGAARKGEIGKLRLDLVKGLHVARRVDLGGK